MKSFERQQQILANRYAIETSLGSGGWGSVYLATDSVLKRKVALKIMHEHLTHEATSVERFDREAEIVSRLVHPNICTLFDKGVTDNGQPYMVMEYLEGKPLDKAIAKDKRISVKRTIHIATQVCDALDYAHKRGVVHRDLKPGNIMILDDDVPKLLDFGLAKWHDNKNITQSGNTVGTPDYMCPEQWNGLELDGRADIYSLGVTMFFMLTGESLVTATGLMPIADFHLNQKPRHLSETRSDLHFPPSLQGILDRCLEKNRDNRFRDAFELKEALLNVMKGTSADPVPSQVLTKAGGGRGKAAVAVIAGGLVLAAGVFAVTRGDRAPQSSTAAKPEGAKVEAAKPQISTSEIANPEVAKPEVAKPEVAKPEVAKPEVTKVPTAAPEVAKTAVATHTSAKTEISKSQAAKPEVAKPEVANPITTANAAPPHVVATTNPVLEQPGSDPEDAGAALKPNVGKFSPRQQAIRQERRRAAGRIVLANLESDDKAIQALEKISDCTQLIMCMSNIGNPAVRYALKKFPDLDFLNVWITHVTDEVMPMIAQSRITGLHVGVTGVSDRGVHALLGTKITELGLEEDNISDSAIADIATLPLQNLVLRFTHVTPASASTIAKMDTLNSLSVGRTKWDDAGVAALERLPHLKHLDLSTTRITDAAVDSLVRMPELEELSVARTRLTDRGVAKLASCEKLRRLDIAAVPISAETATALAQAPALMIIRLPANTPTEIAAIFTAKQIHISDSRRSIFTARGWNRFR